MKMLMPSGDLYGVPDLCKAIYSKIDISFMLYSSLFMMHDSLEIQPQARCSSSSTESTPQHPRRCRPHHISPTVATTTIWKRMAHIYLWNRFQSSESGPIKRPRFLSAVIYQRDKPQRVLPQQTRHYHRPLLFFPLCLYSRMLAYIPESIRTSKSGRLPTHR